jgi:hypothetical protein
MANVQHAALTTTDLHEPKGAAGASAFEVYVADGAGSGAWTISPHGWGMYADSKTGVTSQNISTGFSKLENDGGGTATVVTSLPPAIRGSGALWDTANDKITPIEVSDAYVISLHASVTSEGSDALRFRFDIGGTGSVSNVVWAQDVLLTGSDYINITSVLHVTATMLTNGVTIYVRTDTNTASLAGTKILINRTHGGTSW